MNTTDPADDLSELLRAVRNYLVDQAELGVFSAPRAAAGALPVPPSPADETENVSQTGPDSAEPAGVGEGHPDTLDSLDRAAQSCTGCSLSEGRNHVVFGSGNPDAGVMFIGEAPGRDEDLQGLPFVGAAGELLTKMIASIGFTREEVYIANVIKCRPPNNRDPLPDEIASCEPFLRSQIEMIRPTVICSLGRFAAQTLLESSDSMGRMRGRVYAYRGIKLVPTYHPAALLRNAQWKRPTWEDLKRVRFEYDGHEL